MATWIMVTVVVFVTGAAVIATLFSEDSPLRHPGLKADPERPIGPSDLRRVSFSTRFRGYDPVEVDRWLAAAADALELAVNETKAVPRRVPSRGTDPSREPQRVDDATLSELVNEPWRRGSWPGPASHDAGEPTERDG